LFVSVRRSIGLIAIRIKPTAMASPVDCGMVSSPRATKRTGLALLVALGAAYSCAPSAFIAQNVRISAIASAASLALGMGVPSAMAADMVPSASDAAFQAPWIVIAAAAAGLAAALLKPKPAAAFLSLGPDRAEIDRIEEEKAREAKEAKEIERRDAIKQLSPVAFVLLPFSGYCVLQLVPHADPPAEEPKPAEAPKPASKPTVSR